MVGKPRGRDPLVPVITRERFVDTTKYVPETISFRTNHSALWGTRIMLKSLSVVAFATTLKHDHGQ